ncbi:MAG: cache domain-containing protein, partial [Thiotrichaceae bacterium]|nr:cache domain-containing protein [Thiotrichaceae bacterium]
MKLKLKQKMFVGSAILALLPVMITAYFTSQIAGDLGQQALTESAQSHITSIRDTKKQQIEGYFGQVANQLLTFADAKGTADAMSEFKNTFANFSEEAGMKAVDEGPSFPQPLPFDQYTEALEEFYLDEFVQEYETLNVDPAPDMAAMLNQLDDNSLALQYFYIAENDNPLGTKSELFSASDSSGYTNVHRQHHREFREYQSRFNLEDIFLIDVDSSNIVYSVRKEIDFATSLNDGPFSKTGIGRVFERMSKASPDEFIIVDFASYLPAYQNPVAFIGTPLFDKGKRIGVLVFELAIHTINDIMTYNRAWRTEESGRTGEAYIVASDGTMRNDSR